MVGQFEGHELQPVHYALQNNLALKAAEKPNDVSAGWFCNQGLTLVGPMEPVKSMLGFSPCKSCEGHSSQDGPFFPQPV
jgi:hypothetical protein